MGQENWCTDSFLLFVSITEPSFSVGRQGSRLEKTHGGLTLSEFAFIIRLVAEPLGYTRDEILAGVEFCRRQNGLSNPPGEFDRMGRFTASERTAAVSEAPAPSASSPHAEHQAAISARHCAELFDANVDHVKRLARAFDLAASASSASDLIQPTRKLATILKRSRSGPEET